MADYINPINESKEALLKREALEISRDEFLDFSIWMEKETETQCVCLCLVQNRVFSACVVSESRADAERYADPNDGRPRKYYLIARSKLDASVVRPRG